MLVLVLVVGGRGGGRGVGFEMAGGEGGTLGCCWCCSNPHLSAYCFLYKLFFGLRKYIQLLISRIWA